MRGKKLQWLMVFSAISGLVWMAGLAWTLKDYFGGGDPVVLQVNPQSTSPTAPQSLPAQAGVQATPAVAKPGTSHILALGDSLTRGFGDSEGKGYAGKFVDLLLANNKQELVLDNLGVNGQTSSQLITLLQQKDVQEKAKASDTLLVSIGANDLFRGGETLLNLDLKKIATIQADYNKELLKIVTQLRELNPNATLFLIGLYNPFIDLKDSATTSKIVRDWNYAAAETLSAFPRTVLVPTFDLFQLQARNLLYIDQFHPNAEGYRLMAERIAALIKQQGASG